MSYHIHDDLIPSRRHRLIPVTRPRASTALSEVTYYPLAEVEEPKPPSTIKIVLTVLAILIIIAIVLWVFSPSRKRLAANTPRRPSRESTAQMARRLYKRLEDRGGISEGTMQSLRQLGRNA